MNSDTTAIETRREICDIRLPSTLCGCYGDRRSYDNCPIGCQRISRAEQARMPDGLTHYSAAFARRPRIAGMKAGISPEGKQAEANGLSRDVRNEPGLP